MKPLSKVYFLNFQAKKNLNIPSLLDSLLKKIPLFDFIEKGDLTAVKLHFGERGNNAFVKPQYLRKIIDSLKNSGAKPFLTDTNTLYVGSRSDAPSHLELAIEHGFDYAVVNAPLVIADGLIGNSFQMVRIEKKWYQEVDIASEIYFADALIAVNHFKCHELSGFGGAIKNIGMGCASRQGKFNQHSLVKPFINGNACNNCRKCLRWCNTPGALVFGNKNAQIVKEKCVGCGACIISCPHGAIKIKWDADTGSLQEKMVEHVYAALKNKGNKAAFITFINQVNPACDCYPFTETPIVNDIGILASHDLVAIDQAAADLVNQQTGRKDSRLLSGHECGGDKFRGVYPNIDWTIQLKYAEELGLGITKYELIEV